MDCVKVDTMGIFGATAVLIPPGKVQAASNSASPVLVSIPLPKLGARLLTPPLHRRSSHRSPNEPQHGKQRRHRHPLPRRRLLLLRQRHRGSRVLLQPPRCVDYPWHGPDDKQEPESEWWRVELYGDDDAGDAFLGRWRD